MSTASTRPRVEINERLYTEADLAAMPSDLPSGPVWYELDDGRLITMTPAGVEHGSYEMRIGAAFYEQGEKKGLGRACTGEVGIVLRRKPPRIVGADVAFIAKRSLPMKKSRSGYLETMPEVVVEVLSPNDTKAYVNRKISDYLDAGVGQVWIADPARREIVIHRRNAQPQSFTENDVLKSHDPIPGFKLPLAEVFAD